MLVLWLAAFARAAERDTYPTSPMPPPVLEFLLDANRTMELTNNRRTTGTALRFISPSKATNEAVLRLLAQTAWPDFTQLRRVRCRHLVDRGMRTNDFAARWLFYHEGNQLILLGDEFAKEWRIARETALEDSDYRAELGGWIGEPKSVAPGKRRQTLIVARETMPLFNHAVAAAWLGHTNEARQLLSLALNADYATDTLWRRAATLGRTSFEEGLTKLRSGAPRSEVLRQWEETLRVFGPTLAHTQLVDYVTVLRQQVAEFPQFTASTVENPDALPPEKRAAYLADRLQEVREPNIYSGISVEDTLTGLGRAAIPALIEHLRDRRLTRVTGLHRSFSSSFRADSFTVLRVQDLALAALEKISKVRFIEGRRMGSEPLFSARDEMARERIASSVEAWWKENAGKSSVHWRLAQLESLSITERLREVAECERLDPQATNYVAMLKSWSAQAGGYSLRELARALEARGDLSLLPRLRQSWERGLFDEVELLLKHGTAEDFGLLRDAERKRRFEQTADGRNSLYAYRLTSLLGGFQPTAALATNRLIVPLLVDMLARREVSESRFTGRFQAAKSDADLAMAVLVSLTGHNEGHAPEDPVAARHGAMDRWQKWWEEKGEVEWLAAHPETRPAFGSPVKTVPAEMDWQDLDRMVRVASPQTEPPVTFEIPRESIPALVRSGAVEVKQFAGVTQVRFRTADAAWKWFARAKAVPFTNASYTMKLDRSVRTIKRPQMTPNAFLFPCLRVEQVQLAAPDSRGRTWLAGRGAGTAYVGRFEDGTWRTMFSAKQDMFGDRSEFRFAHALRDGAMLFAEGMGVKTRYHLLHDGEHLEFSDFETMLEREGPRLRKLVSFPPDPREGSSGGNAAFALVKDREGNLWWSQGARHGVLKGAQMVRFKAADADGGGPFGQVNWLSPLPRGAGVVMASYRQAQMLVLSSNTVRVERTADLPPQTLGSPGSRWPRFVRESDGSFWVSTRASMAFDAGLNRVGAESGHLLLRDSRDALWLVDFNHSLDAGLTRVAKDGARSALRLRGIHGPPCDAGDGTVWALTAEGIVRVGMKRDRLTVVAEAPVAPAGDSRLWADDGGLLWLSAENDHYYGRQSGLSAHMTRH
jgi:hypothetical protein